MVTLLVCLPALAITPHAIDPTLAAPGAPGPVAFVSMAAVGDIDADGYDDLAAVTLSEGALWIPGSDIGPDLDAAITLEPYYSAFPTASGDVARAIGDVDGDGWDDIAVSNRAYKGVGALAVYRGGAAGPSGTPTWSWALGGITDIAPLGDLDGDHRDEFVVATTGGLVIYRGGSRGPSEKTRISGMSVLEVARADVDGDGDAEDLVAIRRGTGVHEVVSLPRTGTWTWTASAAVTVLDDDIPGRRITTHGDDALVSGRRSGRAVSLLTTSIGLVAREWAGYTLLSGALYDLDADGTDELLFVNEYYNIVQADVTSGALLAYLAGSAPCLARAGDVDGDGLDDLIVYGEGKGLWIAGSEL